MESTFRPLKDTKSFCVATFRGFNMLAAFYFRNFKFYSFSILTHFGVRILIEILTEILPACKLPYLPPHHLACLHTTLPASTLSYLPSHDLAFLHTVSRPWADTTVDIESRVHKAAGVRLCLNVSPASARLYLSVSQLSISITRYRHHHQQC